MNMTEEIAEQVVEKQYVLNAIDRCDQCSAQAYVLVKLVAGELQFCNHHYNNNESALKKLAYEIIDEREKLIENRLQGSPN